MKHNWVRLEDDTLINLDTVISVEKFERHIVISANDNISISGSLVDYDLIKSKLFSAGGN